MKEATKPRASGCPHRLAVAASLLAAVALLAAGSAGAGVPHQNGKYSGKTSQTSVNSPFNQIKFQVKKGRVTLTTEPTVARGLCTSAPVFTLDGTPSKKISRNGSFSFKKTFFGNKFDQINGRFVSSKEIQGTAIYHFQSQDLCSQGKTKVAFKAKHK